MKITEQRLSTILKVKENQKKVAQQELHSIKKEKKRQLETLDHLEETKEAAIGGLTRSGIIRATDVHVNRAYIQHLTQQLKLQMKKITTIETEENDKREELMEKTKSKRIVEKLEEKRQAEVHLESQRKEQRLMDVLANRVQWEIK
jgi:flagellar protein FliJ